jgi:hypothetical protein
MRAAGGLLLTICLLVGASPRGAADEAWPFGSRGGPMAMGRDLYNLGLLGAKARDADAEPPAPMTAGGGRRVGQGAPDTGDDGPARLAVEILFPDGPASKAGLRVGDVVVGAGRGPFKEGSLDPLAEALRKAESGKSGELTLWVEREGEKRRKIDVVIPVGGKAAAKPTKGAGRTRIVDAALAWLAARQEPGGGFAQTLSGINGAVCQTAIAGLAWLAGGSDDQEGPYADNVARAVSFVIDNAGRTMGMGGAAMPGARGSMDQTNWGYAHAAIFLGELHARRPSAKVKRALIAAGTALAERQEASGGWAHGPGGPNPLGYLELNIVTGLALCGMGLAQQAGCVLPEGVLEKAEAYLKASSGGGGVGYSANPGQAGQGNIGRSAGCWLGFGTLGLSKSPFAGQMKRWVTRNAGAIQGGHASLMQHVFLAGVAAHALGGKARSAYWEAAERDLILARAPDGSLQPRPWRESLSMGTNSDVSFGEVWTTSAWAVVLACEPEKGVRPGLPAWMSLRPAK